MSKGIGITMADDRRATTPFTTSLAGPDVRDLARAAIRVLARKKEERPIPLQRRLEYLSAAFLEDDDEPRRGAIEALLSEGVLPAEIIDHIIPEVARIYGQRWADDSLSFAEVTIGSARLQEAVRSLMSRDVQIQDPVRPVDARADGQKSRRILMVVPRPEDHTLGTFVAADQFRRFGFSVDIAVDTHPRQIALDILKNRYAMVGITVGGRRTLASARELVDIIRTTATRVTPVVLGGSYVNTRSDLKGMTGADHVAVSVRDALEKCGFDIVGADPSENTMLGHE